MGHQVRRSYFQAFQTNAGRIPAVKHKLLLFDRISQAFDYFKLRQLQ